MANTAHQALVARVTKNIRSIPDFPKKGILFRDITPLLQNGKMFGEVIKYFAARYRGKKISAVACIESRGFIFGSALAYELGVGFIPLRKPGKLPYDTYKMKYDLEYGTSTLEIHKDALKHGDRVVLIDDLLATGGTMAAAVKLVKKLGAQVVETDFIIELAALKGKSKLEVGKVHTLISY